MGGTAILLAGGLSARMGQQKGMLPWHGQTLFEHQIGTLLQSPFSNVIAVVGYRSERFEQIAKNYPVKVVRNDRFQSGKCTSIIAGLKAADMAAANILIAAVDQPASQLTLERLYTEQMGSNSLIAIPVYRGKHGHPIVFSRVLFDELLSIKEETKGLRSIFQKYRNDVKEVLVDDSGILLNLNTPEDYNRALKDL
ncbi:nucleotidyltransferase family protein [Cytobacillus sp. NCCP-133]|uniref:nucleotidyltransferase family protein n=1 Tax=Cytobacillus sp. NCCP-133 TaxID=766848 RepID=UPI002231DA69|nr:nucleotidyltransferase family protein [Cytobacillus sp. NCCP-133]GLB61332.1 hypothetical protein NCCP133_34620 [Cytobacillus sp. NCCP-133]